MAQYEAMATAMAKGDALPGNDELQKCDLWDAFDSSISFTLLLFGNAQHEHQFETRISIGRGAFGQQLEKIALLSLGKTVGPWLHTAEKIAPEKLPKIDKVPIRVLAPSVYRSHFLPDRQLQDSAAHVVAALAQAAQVSTAHLLGGQWFTRGVGSSSHLIGHLRVKPDILAKIQPHTKLQVARQQPMFFGQGGGHDLGFPKTDEAVPNNHAKAVSIQGIPRVWDEDDVTSFLLSNKWSDVVLSSERRHLWFGRGTPPSGL